MARVLSKIPVGKIKSLTVSQNQKLSQQKQEKEQAKKAANVAQYEKEKAARATTGSRYGYDTMSGNARTLNTNPRARTYREFIEIADNVVEAFALAADKSKPQSPTPTKLPLSRERNIGKHDDWKDKPSTEWGERTPAAKKLASRASAVVGTQRRQDKEAGVANEEYQLIIDYLIEEGYAQNIEEAEDIYLNLDEGLLGDVGKLAWKGTKATLRAVRNYGEKYPVGSKRRAVADVLSHIRSATLSDAEKRKRANAKHRARNTKKGHEEIMAKNRESQEISDRWHEKQRKKQEKRRAQTGKYRGLGVGSKESVKKEEYEIDEAKVDKKLPDYKRSAARLARYDNPSGALALGGGQQRARRAEHEARRRVKKSKA